MKAQLTPYLMSEDARTQAEMYKQALGGEILSVMTYSQVPGTPEAMRDKVMHLAMTVAGGNTLFLSDSFGPADGSRGIALALAFEAKPKPGKHMRISARAVPSSIHSIFSPGELITVKL